MILDSLKQELLQAQRTQDEVKLRSLRVLLAEIKNKEIEFRALGKVLQDADIVSIIQKGIKSRTEAVGLYKKGGREDLVKKEEEEIVVLKQYLPEMLSEERQEEEIKKAILESGASGISGMGKVMALLKERLQGKADMGQVGALVKKLLEEGSYAK